MLYPDSADELEQSAAGVWSFTDDNGDHVSTDYDRLGRTISTTDQRGVVHEYEYDSAGRIFIDAVTSLGTSNIVDGTVRSIHTTYDDVGRVQTVTSLGDGSPAAVRNQVKYAFDGWGNLSQEWQSHDGEVDEQTTPSVQYTYDDGYVSPSGSRPAPYVRLSHVTYPDGDRNVGYNYAAGVDNIMSRLSSIFDDADADGVLDAASPSTPPTSISAQARSSKRTTRTST